jgi:hypothetical protein
MTQEKKKKGSHLLSGKQGVEAVEQFEAQRGSILSNRFWLEAGSSSKVVLLDEEPVFLKEHRFKKDGSWNHYIPCIQDFDQCPLCEDGKKPSFVAVYTVFDLVERTTAKDYKIKPGKKLFVTKGRARIRLQKRVDDQGGAQWRVFELGRDTDEEIAVGEDIQFLKALKKAEVLKLSKKLAPKGISPEDFMKPYDYAEVFPLPTRAEVQKAMGGLAVPGSAAEETGLDEENGGSIENLEDLL